MSSVTRIYYISITQCDLDMLIDITLSLIKQKDADDCESNREETKKLRRIYLKLVNKYERISNIK